MNKLLTSYRGLRSFITALKLAAYDRKHPMAATVLSKEDAELLAVAIAHAKHGATMEVFEPMRNARGEIVDPVFNGEVA